MEEAVLSVEPIDDTWGIMKLEVRNRLRYRGMNSRHYRTVGPLLVLLVCLEVPAARGDEDRPLDWRRGQSARRAAWRPEKGIAISAGVSCAGARVARRCARLRRRCRS